MASQAIQEGTPTGGQDSPLEIAKRLVTPMCRQPKEAHWRGGPDAALSVWVTQEQEGLS